MSTPQFVPPSHPHRPGLVVPVRVDPRGIEGPTRAQARTRHWRTTSRGLVVPATVERTVDQRILEAARLLRPYPGPGAGAVTGWAGLRWCGARWLDGSTPDDPHGLPVDLAVFGDLRRRDGIVVCEEGLDPRDVILVDGMPVTLPVRSVAYAMRYATGVRAAATALSMAAHDDLVSLDEADRYVGPAPRSGLSSWTGVPQARAAVLLADENCWSPQEAGMLSVWLLDACLPRPLMNHPVFDRDGRHVGTPDLLDPESGTACEYEGGVHLDRRIRAVDVRREEAFRDVGLEVLTLMAGDGADREQTARRMIAARARARWLPEHERAWTVVPPPWWTPTVTVAQRRALSAEQRDRLLRHRRAA